MLRDARGIAAPSAPLTLVVERPDGVEYRRALVQDQGVGGRSLDVPLVSSAMSGTWRVSAYTDPKRPPVGETTFMVEDYVPDRIEFDLSSAASAISSHAPAQVSVDGRFLYGAPASNLELAGAVTIAAAKERPGFPGYSFGLADDAVTAVRQELDDLPDTDAAGKASFAVKLDKVPATTRPLEARVTVSMAESGGRAVERKLTLPVTPDADDDRRQAGFLRPLARRRRQCRFRRGDGRARRRQAGEEGPALRAAQDRRRRYQWYRQSGQWEYEPVKRTERVADGKLDVAADKPARLSLPVKWGRYRLEVSAGDVVTSLTFDAGFYAEVARRHARPAGSRARQERLQARRDDLCGGDRAQPPAA